jgi:prevent-host-death family protein
LESYERRAAVDWQLQEAKSKFSELVRRTFEEGPQTITRHGRDVVVMVSGEEYRRLVGEKPDFKEFLMSAPEGLEVIDTSLPEGDYPREPELEFVPEDSEPGGSGPGRPSRHPRAG